MNDNKKSKNIILAFIQSILAIFGFLSLFLGYYISLYPEVVREKVGDRIMARLVELPLSLIGSTLFVIFIIVFLYMLWLNSVFDKNDVLLSNKDFGEKFKASKGSVAVKENKGSISITNNYPEDKKKELAREMGIVLNSFQQHIKDVSDAHDEKMFGKLRIAHEEFYELRDDFLSNGKALLDNSIDIENAFKSLNKAYSDYADGLKKYLYLIENNPFANKQPTMDEINNHPYFVEKIGLGTSLRASELLSNVNEEIERLRRLIKKNLL
jgi:hypothetical protein